MKRQVEIIPANPMLHAASGRQAAQIQKVAAYCRVSTDSKDQLNSYASQMDYYHQKINANPAWELVKVYADEGITGTSMKKRDDFRRMISDCRKGNIHLILCKSVSRFARNTVDCLDVVRELKSMGIGVQFEKENVHTLKESSEFLLTLFSGFAQAESESLSANVTWGKRKSMRDGIVAFQNLLGYERGEGNAYIIVPEDAKIVVRIYKEYLAGYSLKRIRDGLEADAIPAPLGKQWSGQAIKNILTNEKYTGDALLQKTYRVDCISKKVRKNNGELPMYLVKDNHEGIITREMFHMVREEMARRSSKKRVLSKTGRTKKGKFSSKYALTERLVCGECGASYRRVTWRERNGNKKIVWRCLSRLESGTLNCKCSPTIDEKTLHKMLTEAINMLLSNSGEILETITEGIKLATIGTADTAKLKKRLNEIREESLRLVDSVTDEEMLTQSLKALNTEGQRIREKLRDLEQNQEVQILKNGILARKMAEIQKLPVKLYEYDDTLTAQVIQSVTVTQDKGLIVQFEVGGEVAMKP